VYKFISFSYASFALANSCLYASSSDFKNCFPARQMPLLLLVVVEQLQEWKLILLLQLLGVGKVKLHHPEPLIPVYQFQY
jgi:hypothetical protein